MNQRVSIRTYGRCRAGAGQIEISELPPHVSMAIKRLFPRLPTWKTGGFLIEATPAACADVLWFMQRYPLEIDEEAHTLLVAGREHDNEQKRIADSILRSDWQPSIIGGFRPDVQPYPYQAQVAELMTLRRGLLLGDDVGLGKTVSSLSVIARTRRLPAAIIVEPHLAEQWDEDAIQQFTDFRAHVIKGTRPYDMPDADIYIFKYSNIAGWVDVAGTGMFKTVVFDEIQQMRTGEKAAKYKAAEVFASRADIVLGLSATPIYNYGGEIYEVLRLVDADALGSRAEFYLEWCHNKGNGNYIVKDPAALGTHLRDIGVFLRRTEEDVGRQLPPTNVIKHWVDYDHAVAASTMDEARNLAMKVLRSSDFTERGQAARELDLLARRVTGLAKAQSVAALTRIMATDGPVLLAGYHRDVYDVWLRDMRDLNPLMYTGSETAKQKRKMREAFINGDSRVLIISLRSGAGLDGLQSVCNRIILGELDWSPQIHKQIIGRLRRPGQKHAVDAVYCLTNEGSDPPMIEMLGLKAGQARGITDPFAGGETVTSDDSRIKALARAYLGDAA